VTIILPFYSQAEVDEFCWLLERWELFTHCEDPYSFLLACRFDAECDVDALMKLCSRYGSVTYVRLPGHRVGFPQGCSEMWAETMRFLHDQGEDSCFWMESDIIPQDPRWLTVGRQKLHGKLVVGHLVTEAWLDANGYTNRQVPGKENETWGTHINGSAFYHPEIIKIFDAVDFNWSFAWDVQLYPHYKNHGFGFPMYDLLLKPHRDDTEHDASYLLVHGVKERSQKEALFAQLQERNKISTEPVPEGAPIPGSDHVFQGGQLVKQKIQVCMPVSHVDAGLLRENMYFARQLGCRIEQPVLLVATRRAAPDVDKLRWFLDNIAEDVEVHVLEDEGEFGYPSAANHLFIRTAELLRERGNELPWYFLEADNTPMRRDWLDLVSTEYYERGKPFLGPCDSLEWTPMARRQYPKGVMNGSSVYPADFCDRVPWLFNGWVPQEPFDLVISQTIMEYVADAETMRHCWKGQDCYISDGFIRGSLGDDTKEFRMPLTEKLSVFHGIKDRSLRTALLERIQQEKARNILDRPESPNSPDSLT